MGLNAIGTKTASFLKRLMQGVPKDQRILAEMDYFRLHALLTAEDKEKCILRKRNSKRLRQILKQGHLIPFKLVPHTVVTMNSEVLLRTPRGTAVNITLVYPKDKDRKKRKISGLSRLGLCILGKRAGEMVSRSIVVEKILFQPEISNQFAL